MLDLQLQRYRTPTDGCLYIVPAPPAPWHPWRSSAALVSAHPPSVMVQNKGGIAPLRMLWDRCALNDEDGRCILSVGAARLHERAAEMERICGVERAYNRSGHVRSLGNSASVWAKVLVMARAAYFGSLDDYSDGSNAADEGAAEPSDGSVFRPLHAIAGIDCPASMVSFAVQVHSQDLGALYEADEKGNLPLHNAASRHHDGSMDCLNAEQFDADRGGTILALAEAAPRSIGVRNKRNRLPLHLAIEAGASWKEGGVRYLVEQAPEVVEERDGVRGLYPFMLAASVGSVEVSFALLRRSPGLVETPH